MMDYQTSIGDYPRLAVEQRTVALPEYYKDEKYIRGILDAVTLAFGKTEQKIILYFDEGVLTIDGKIGKIVSFQPKEHKDDR